MPRGPPHRCKLLVKYGAIITQASGALGAVTFANRAGTPIARVRGRRCQQSTPDQLSQHSVYMRAIQAWRSLSALVQLAWSIYAAKNQRRNRLGTWRRLTPFQCYMAQAMLRLKAGLSAPTNPPTYGQQGIGTPWEISFYDGGPYTFAFACPTIDPNGYYLLDGHRPLSKSAYKKPYFHALPAQRFVGSNTVDLYTPWVALMGDMEVGELFVIKIRYLGDKSLCSAPATWHSTVLSP